MATSNLHKKMTEFEGNAKNFTINGGIMYKNFFIKIHIYIYMCVCVCVCVGIVR